MTKFLNNNITSKESLINSIKTYVYKIPTDFPESDGTIEWDSTTLIVVFIQTHHQIGLGYTYGHEGISKVIQSTFVPFLKNSNAMNVPLLWEKMLDASRNIGSRGIAASAIAAVDIALWDLKAKILKVPLCTLLGQVRESVPVYGSGGFTSYSKTQLAKQFEDWKSKGIDKFKMKVGRNPDIDVQRVKEARDVIGSSNELFVDANGAYTRKQALEFAERFKEFSVSWFEEPVSSDDLNGLHLLCDRAPPGMNIAAGEYGYEIFYFRKILEAQAVDILQADATRCCGFTGFFQACQLSRAFNLPLSSHCAPSLHLHPSLSQRHVCHMEFFHDHERIDEMFFEGVPKLIKGCLYPDLNRFGHGLELKEKHVKKFLTTSFSS
jgi:L-alanine-DL-glutamate epimerase-like enolase superfamily enzyme